MPGYSKNDDEIKKNGNTKNSLPLQLLKAIQKMLELSTYMLAFLELICTPQKIIDLLAIQQMLLKIQDWEHIRMARETSDLKQKWRASGLGFNVFTNSALNFSSKQEQK